MSEGLIRYLVDRLKDELPGDESRMALEPPMSYGRHRGPAPDYARRAAVMLVLHQGKGLFLYINKLCCYMALFVYG